MLNNEKLVRVGVGIIVIDAGLNVLLGTRKGDRFGQGEWHIPGGKMEVGETTDACARRELREETGLYLPNSAFLRYTWSPDALIGPDGNQWVTLFYTVFLDEVKPEIDNPEPDKCGGWSWHDPNTLPPCWRGVDQIIKDYLGALF